MKALFKIIIALVLVLVVGLVAAYLGRNVIAGAVIPSVATSTLGVKVELGSADLDFGTPAVTLTQLDVGNPAAFKQPYSLKMGTVSVSVDRANTSASKVTVEQVSLDKMSIWFIQDGATNNIAAIVDGIGGGAAAGEGTSSGSEIEIVIKKMVLTNLEVNASVAGLDSPVIVLDRIELSDISSKAPADGLTAQLSAKIFEVTMQAVTEACSKQLPGAITASMGKSLEGAGVIIGDASAAAMESASKAAGEATKALGDATKGIGGLFGGDKPK